ncbi:hypothetical protein ACFC4S_31145 [Priestia megaterium]|uniref:hypothetical protein n=1 Tax=Priestia megaterium TaxID=1404 RepID=UPI0035DFAB29
MFVNYSLEDIKNNKVQLEQKSQKLDLETIIEQLKIEGFELTNWSLIEIAKSEDKRVYGFESLNKKLFYMKIGANRQATPHYFKNHGLGEYSEFQAESIKDAIKQYENFYIVKES